MDNIEVSKKFVFKFPENNEIRFGMDFRFFRGVPSDVEFEFRRRLNNDLYEFAGKGYGFRADYGSGSIYIFGSDLPDTIKTFIANNLNV